MAFEQEWFLFRSSDSGSSRRSIASAVSLLWLATTIAPAQSRLQVASPANGTVVNAGSALTVTVTAPPSAFQSVSIVGDGPFALSTGLAAPPYQYSYPIPVDFALGRYRFKAAGTTASGGTIYSDPIEVDIERPDDARKLQWEWQSLASGDQPVAPILIWGVFRDGSKVDVTRSSRTTYASDRLGVTVVSSQSSVSVVGAGKARITVKYGDKTIVVPVDITQNPARQ